MHLTSLILLIQLSGACLCLIVGCKGSGAARKGASRNPFHAWNFRGTVRH